jgi:hypothetical protein
MRTRPTSSHRPPSGGSQLQARVSRTSRDPLGGPGGGSGEASAAAQALTNAAITTVSLRAREATDRSWAWRLRAFLPHIHMIRSALQVDQSCRTA